MARPDAKPNMQNGVISSLFQTLFPDKPRTHGRSYHKRDLQTERCSRGLCVAALHDGSDLWLKGFYVSDALSDMPDNLGGLFAVAQPFPQRRSKDLIRHGCGQRNAGNAAERSEEV